MHWSFDGECDIPKEIIDRVKFDGIDGYVLELTKNFGDDPIDVWLMESDGETWTFQRIEFIDGVGKWVRIGEPFTLKYEQFHNLHVC